jgi:hypothetical protein
MLNCDQNVGLNGKIAYSKAFAGFRDINPTATAFDNYVL